MFFRAKRSSESIVYLNLILKRITLNGWQLLLESWDLLQDTMVVDKT